MSVKNFYNTGPSLTKRTYSCIFWKENGNKAKRGERETEAEREREREREGEREFETVK